MARVKKIDSKEVGLEIGLIFFKFFLKTEYLHYGYFVDGLKADIADLAKAQEAYAELLISKIPEGTKTILDVGGGSGKTAQKLTSLGYQVEFVSPSKLLNQYASNLLGDTVTVHTKKFEDLDASKKFDLILFSESFQYIPIDDALGNAKNHLNPGGHIIVSDFFMRDEVEGRGSLGGGHKWSDWQEKLPKHNLETVYEQDITEETAPTIEIVNQMTMQVLHPIWNLIFLLAGDRYPRLLKFIKWKYKKKLDKMENKHFKGERNGANFIKYKKYMMYLFKA